MAKDITATPNWSVKYRPRTLAEMVGQEGAANLVKGAFKRGEISQTILVSGETGNGKTTIARIIAMMINKFDLTKNASDFIDILEMNASEKRGIDDVRALIGSLKFLPQLGKYKVIIIDEAHQLTSAAASALLKPLEEPPAHVVWILATNEPHRLLETIRKRCMRINLSRVTPKQVMPLIQQVAEKENVFQPSKKYKIVFQTIAESVGGQPRDALQVLNSLANSHAVNPINADDEEALQASLKEALKDLDVGVDRVAIALMLSLYKINGRAITVIGDTADYQGLAYKLLDLNSYIICQLAKIDTWSNYARVTMSKAMVHEDVKPNLEELSIIHNGLIQMRQQIMMATTDDFHIILGHISAILVKLRQIKVSRKDK